MDATERSVDVDDLMLASYSFMPRREVSVLGASYPLCSLFLRRMFLRSDIADG
jgi:hypothetical protein